MPTPLKLTSKTLSIVHLLQSIGALWALVADAVQGPDDSAVVVVVLVPGQVDDDVGAAGTADRAGEVKWLERCECEARLEGAGCCWVSDGCAGVAEDTADGWVGVEWSMLEIDVGVQTLEELMYLGRGCHHTRSFPSGFESSSFLRVCPHSG